MRDILYADIARFVAFVIGAGVVIADAAWLRTWWPSLIGVVVLVAGQVFRDTCYWLIEKAGW